MAKRPQPRPALSTNSPQGSEEVHIPDARASDAQLEDRLNASFAATFETPSGRDVLGYLKLGLVQTILPATATDAELRYREGQRSVIGIIEERIGRAHHVGRRTD